MKNALERLVALEMVIAVVVLAIAGLSGVARAEPAQQFTLSLRSTVPDGPVTFRFRLATYDTTGAVPPARTDHYLRLPAGAALRRQFLNPSWFCDGPALRDALDAHPTGAPFNERVANLRPFIRSLARATSKKDGAALANARVCERARMGTGTAKVDGRKVSATLFPDPIPASLSLFFSRGTVPGAIAGIVAVGAADADSPIARRYPVVAATHVALVVNILDDPTPDGVYGYKVLLPIGRINGLDVSIPEENVTLRALKLAKGTCLKQDRRGRCTRRQKEDLYSFVAPQCPPSGQLSALLFSGYAAPVPSSTTTVQLPCPRYSL